MFFYLGFTFGVFFDGICVALISKIYWWHYGFGLSGVGMVLGVSVFLYGQKYLKGVGDPPKPRTEAKLEIKKPLTKIEKDRIVVLLLSFLSLSYYL